MGQGRSIHIGLNSVDPAQYHGWSGDLMACEFDAEDMAVIAESRGFAPTTILTADATADTVLGALQSAAEELTEGDTLLLTYSGHGGRTPDLEGDEDDGCDETWCLYDRQVLDDELYRAFAAFGDGVRIAVFSDSCHSGTITRVGPPSAAGAATSALVAVDGLPPGSRSREMPPALAQKDFLRRQQLYTKLKNESKEVDVDTIRPCVLLISGCQDVQTSADGTYNGLFTATLLTVWNGGRFQGSYRSLHKRIKDRMPSNQVPNLTVVGQLDRVFVSEGQAFSR
jgi:metacaspase-1